MALTKLQQMINPEVLADMLSAELPEAIRFTGVAPIDYTLQGQPGDTITYPVFKYIGDAKDVAEGEAIDFELLETDSENFTVKKVGKGVKFSDEAVLSGYGDPVGEGVRQIAMAVASKIDNDILEAINQTSLEATAEKLDATFIDAIEDAFNSEDGETGVIFLNPKDFRELRSNMFEEYTRASALGDQVLVKGVMGEVLGWQLVQSNKVDEGKPVAVKTGALRTILKRGFVGESDRDIEHQVTRFVGTQHYVVGLVDESRALKINVGGATQASTKTT